MEGVKGAAKSSLPQHVKTGKVYSPLGLRIAMSGVVLENTLDFKQAVLLSLFCSGSLYFFLLLNYQIIATEKI